MTNFKEGQKVKCVSKFDGLQNPKIFWGELKDLDLGKIYTVRSAVTFSKYTKLFINGLEGSFNSVMFQPVKEFETVILSSYNKMPVTLLLDGRHRNITDEQFEDIKVYIRKIINVTRVDSDMYACVKCHYTGSKHDIITHKCKGETLEAELQKWEEAGVEAFHDTEKVIGKPTELANRIQTWIHKFSDPKIPIGKYGASGLVIDNMEIDKFIEHITKEK